MGIEARLMLARAGFWEVEPLACSSRESRAAPLPPARFVDEQEKIAKASTPHRGVGPGGVPL
jgi:hypothetical protein